MIGPLDLPKWATDLGYHVFYDGIADVWVAAHLAPNNNHGANFAPYKTKAEAVARCIREASQ